MPSQSSEKFCGQIVTEAQLKDIMEIIETFPGSKIIGKTFRAIHDYHEIPILPAEFVDPENATGVVYSVPGHAPSFLSRTSPTAFAGTPTTIT